MKRIAIIGGGPSGASLATYLARAGRSVALFHSGKRPPLVIGESLVPATIPFIRALGIEEEVRDYSVYKPGASFVLHKGQEQMHFRFDEVRRATTTYSYNVPRDRFDASILAAAERAGANVIAGTARTERAGDDCIRLSDETMALAEGVLEGQPDLIVDASGRARQVPKLLSLACEVGERRDTALFAHMEGVGLLNPGNVHTDILERGWSWRIPLPGRVSVGLVIDSEHIKRFGDSSEEQFDSYLQHDPVILDWKGSPRRISPVLKYTNYQLVSERGVGANWALVGDTFGFVDPVFSSGLLIGLDGALELSKAILAGGSHRTMARYERHVSRHLRTWHRVVGNYYNGRLFTLFRIGKMVTTTRVGKMLDFHFRKHLPRVFTGEATTRFYSVALLDFMCRYGLVDNDPSELAVL